MLPNFMIIGAARSGTSALYEYLDQHPQVFMSDPKEPHFFAFMEQETSFRGPGDDVMLNDVVVPDREAYERLFRNAEDATAVGEGSVSSLYYPEAARNIKALVPGARLVCMLRNPADRAYSAFMYMRSRLYEPLDDFRAALDAEPKRIDENWHHIWHYRRMGRYLRQVKRYLDLFGHEQMRIYLYDDFHRDPSAVLRDVFGFLGVDDSFVPPDEPSPVVSGEPKNKVLQTFLMRSRPIKEVVRATLPSSVRRRVQRGLVSRNLERSPLAPDLKAELLDFYRDETLALGDLIGRDLSSWFLVD